MKNFSLQTIALLLTSFACIVSCKKEDIQPSPDMTTSLRSCAESEPMVMTPYGRVPASRVHEVDNKTTVKVVGGHLRMLDKETGSLVKDLGLLPTEDLQRYGVHLPASKGNMNSRADQSAGINGFTAAATSGTSYPGYEVYNDDITNIQSFSTTWTVPQLPLDTSFTVTYLWNGLAGGRLQPVMEYYGGSTYYIANWYTTDDETEILHGATIPVPVGTQLTGVISFVSHNDTEWTYKESFAGYPEADITVVRNSEANGIIEAWEAYTQLLSQWPNQPVVAMKDIRLTFRTGTPSPTIDWFPYGDPINTPSRKNTVVVCNSSSNGEVDFYFGDGTGISPDSSYNIVPAAGGKSVLDATSFFANGTPVVLRNHNGASSQTWKLISLHNGYYKLLPGNAPAKAMTVKENHAAAGALPRIYPDDGTAGQQWKITPAENGYCTLSPADAPSLSLSIANGIVVKGTKLLQLRATSNTEGEKFKFVQP